MFYTLSSKFLIKNATTKDFLYIFLSGSVGYIAIHWYLHKHNIKLDYVKYIYYFMVIDLAVSYYIINNNTKRLVKLEKENSKNNDISKSKEINTQKIEYTPEEKLLILRRMQEARQMQLRNKLNNEQRIEVIDENINYDVNNEENIENDEALECKKSIFTKSDEESKESEESKNTKNSKDEEKENKELVKVKKKTTEDMEDTELPLYKSNK
jgi:hypothetical protein